jgi:hypothetical protein
MVAREGHGSEAGRLTTSNNLTTACRRGIPKRAMMGSHNIAVKRLKAINAERERALLLS